MSLNGEVGRCWGDEEGSQSDERSGKPSEKKDIVEITAKGKEGGPEPRIQENLIKLLRLSTLGTENNAVTSVPTLAAQTFLHRHSSPLKAVVKERMVHETRAMVVSIQTTSRLTA